MTEERKRRKAGKCGRVFRRSDALDTLHETNRIKGLNGKGISFRNKGKSGEAKNKRRYSFFFRDDLFLTQTRLIQKDLHLKPDILQSLQPNSPGLIFALILPLPPLHHSNIVFYEKTTLTARPLLRTVLLQK